MQFDVKDRLMLLGILGKAEGNLATLRVVRELQHAAGFTEDEGKALNFQQADGTIRWDDGAVGSKEVAVGDFARKAVLAIFKKIEDGNSLNLEMLPLYEKFLLTEEG